MYRHSALTCVYALRVPQNERKLVAEAKRAIEVLEHKLRNGKVASPTFGRLQELAQGGCDVVLRRRAPL